MCLTIGQHTRWVCYTCSCAQLLSHAWLFVTPGAIALQAHLSLGFPRQEYWSGLMFPPPGDLLNPLFVTQQVAIADMFSNGETVFWFSLELQIFKNTRIQRKEVWKEIWVRTGLFHIHFSLACGNVCTYASLWYFYQGEKKIVIMNSIPWKVCFVLFCLFLCVMLKCALGHIKS